MPSTPPPQVWPTLRAHDARALIRYLVDVIGFQETVTYGDGDIVDHCELHWPEGGGVMLGSSRDASGDRPGVEPGTFGAYVVTDEIATLYARVQHHGADITDTLHTTEYGSTEFGIRDPEGNRWSFGTYRGADLE